MKWNWSVMVLALITASCSDSGISPGVGDFNMKFSCGVDARNVLNTFDDTFTKDLITDGTTTVPFKVSDSALQEIRTRMQEIGFFNYPDTFVVPPEDTASYVTPHPTYIFDVANNSTRKHLFWSDCHVSQDSAAMNLRQLIRLIEHIVVSNPRYAELPPARGGYQ